MNDEKERHLHRILRLIAHAAVVTALSLGAASATEVPARKSGLWIVKSQDNAFANWKMCVNDKNNTFLNSDVWSNFKKECKVRSLTGNGNGYTLISNCNSSLTGDVRLIVDFSGDFRTAYTFKSNTETMGLSQQVDRQTITVSASFAGECPAGMRPGMKRMGRQ